MLRLTLLSLCIGFFPSVAPAAPITYVFSGDATIVAAGLSPFVQFGSALTWSFTIDSEAPDLLPSDPNVGSYALGASAWSAGSLTGTANGGSITFSNLPPFVGDSIGIDASSMTFSTSMGFTPTRIHLILQDPSGLAFDTSTPPTSLDVSSFTVTGLGMAIDGFELDWLNGLSVLAPVSVATAAPQVVPEPGTFLLISAGLGLFARCKKQSSSAVRRNTSHR